MRCDDQDVMMDRCQDVMVDRAGGGKRIVVLEWSARLEHWIREIVDEIVEVVRDESRFCEMKCQGEMMRPCLGSD